MRLPGYFPLILGHQGLGLLAALVAVASLLLPRAPGMAPRWPLAAVVGGGSLGSLALGRSGVAGALAPWGLALAAVGLVVCGLLDEDDDRARGRLRLAAAMGVAVAVVYAALLDFAAAPELRPGQELHSQVGAWSAALLCLALASAPLRRLPGPPVVALALVAGLAVAWGAGAAALRPGAGGLQPVRYSTLLPEDGSEPLWVDRERLDGSDSCGQAGCHEAIHRQWAGSPHRFAAANRFYLAAVAGLVEQQRWSGVRFCAACHDPAAVLSGTVEESYADGGPGPESEGVGCVVCHSIRKVHGRPPSNGSMDLDLPPPYPGGKERLAELIRLDSRRHHLAYAGNPATGTSSICRACHRVQVGRDGELVLKHAEAPVAGEGRDDERCSDCHLAPSGGTKVSHAMAGIGMDLARYALAGEQELELIEEHARAARAQVGVFDYVPIDGPDWSRPDAGLREPAGQLLDLFVEPSIDPETREILLALTTHSTARGHSFPSGPWDLQQVWLELRVADRTGRVIHHQGRLDEDGRIEGDPLRLGALLLDSEGHPIQRHEILRLYALAQKRVLAAQGEPIEDLVRLAPPEGSEPPYDVRLRWMFRRAGRDFATWALDSDEMTLPAWELVGTRLVVDHL